MKKVISFGEVMMRLTPPYYNKFLQSDNFNIIYGGSEANVAVSLANFNIPSVHVTTFPDNDLGKAAFQTLRKNGVDVSQIYFGEGRLGLYFCEVGAVNRSSKIIYDRYNSAFSLIKPNSFNWEKIFENANWFHWSGITPALSESCAFECLKAIEIANKMGLTISADIYFRSGLWQYGKLPEQILPELISKSHIVLADEQAMDKYLDCKYEKSDNPFVTSAQKLIKKFPGIKKVVDTQRISINASHNQISACMWNGSEFFQTQLMDITNIIDRIGSGDAFYAGLIYGLLTFKEEKEALEFGICASALKHTIKGDINLATVDDVITLMKGEKSGRIIR